MELGRVLFLLSAFATHSFIGYALVRGCTDVDPRLGLVLGLLPDSDFLFPADWGWPFVHRGLTHTPLFAIGLLAGLYLVNRNRSVTLAGGLAIGSHLAIDSLSPMGIRWLFPLKTTWNPSLGLAVHSPTATALLWMAALGLLAFRAIQRPSHDREPATDRKHKHETEQPTPTPDATTELE
ncbi:metal-dependent hydrolase [Natrialba taiwanensis]|uniref:Membrane-bound metal-dependent hydrolase n=1 Tax=Natrialba taiwanensis DSM 12281 TaxID=1230458 RepID=M0AEG5_9EURY|nr:metal-dependent hydrolase [Natrialba taiwanensis]ELY96796.1 hypothetical protein C484_00140 [Natrialba taiwanensis DSM 12281]